MAASPRLTRALHQQLGDELSRELLTWMDQMDSTRAELTEFHSEMLKFVIQTNRRFDVVEARIGALDTRFDRFESKLERLEEQLDKRHHELMKWFFTCWCGSVLAIVALVLAAR